MVKLTQPMPTSVITKETKIKEIPLKITFFKSSQTFKSFFRFDIRRKISWNGIDR